MCFGKAARNKDLVDRCRFLDSWWPRLSRVPCALRSKLATLSVKFWAKAIHGSSGAPLGEAHIGQFRTKAVRALGIMHAGANPLLRLSVELPVAADPGFYQVLTTLLDARRLCGKLPKLLAQWQLFMQRFAGDIQHGPFSNLVQVCTQLSWRVLGPTLFEDEEGLCHDLLEMPEQLLRQFVIRAWLQHVARSVGHRPPLI